MLTLKIGRHAYKITKDDRFLDNGACVQLLTQSEERSSWGSRPNPVLSKRAIKELSKCKKALHDSPYAANASLIYFGIEEQN